MCIFLWFSVIILSYILVVFSIWWKCIWHFWKLQLMQMFPIWIAKICFLHSLAKARYNATGHQRYLSKQLQIAILKKWVFGVMMIFHWAHFHDKLGEWGWRRYEIGWQLSQWVWGGCRWQPHHIFVTTITTAGCVKVLSQV